MRGVPDNTSTFWAHFWCSLDILGHLLKLWWVRQKTLSNISTNPPERVSWHPVGLVDTLAQLSQIFLVFSMNQCPTYMCVSSCSHYLPCEVCAFPIARHTHQCIAIQWNLVGRCVVRDGHRIMYWYRIMDWCWKLLVIYLNQLFFIKATKAAWQDRLSKFEVLGCSKIWHS